MFASEPGDIGVPGLPPLLMKELREQLKDKTSPQIKYVLHILT